MAHISLELCAEQKILKLLATRHEGQLHVHRFMILCRLVRLQKEIRPCFRFEHEPGIKRPRNARRERLSVKSFSESFLRFSIFPGPEGGSN